MNFLIIGSLNSLASNLVNFYTIKTTNKYICVDALINKDDTNKILIAHLPNYIFYKTNIFSDEFENIFLQHKIDYVINFAQLSETLINNYSYEDYLYYNYETVKRLYELSTRYNIKHFNHISTVEVYGHSKDGIFTEDSMCNPISDYAKTKYLAEKYLLLENKIPTSICRVDTFFSSIQSSNKFIPSIIDAAMNKTKLILDANENNIRSFIDAMDCVFFINEISIKNSIGVYNIASNYYVNYRSIVNIICNFFNYCTDNIIFTNNKTIQIVASSNLALEKFNYKIENQAEKFLYYLKEVKYLKLLYSNLNK